MNIKVDRYLVVKVGRLCLCFSNLTTYLLIRAPRLMIRCCLNKSLTKICETNLIDDDRFILNIMRLVTFIMVVMILEARHLPANGRGLTEFC